MKVQLDPWQQEVMDAEGNVVLRSGRQTGKSTVISMKAAEYAIKHRKKLVMVVAAVERQAYLLFEKTLGYLADNYPSLIKTGKDRPTKHVINLKNGTRIMCLPTGLTGYGIRGFTIDLLIVDEAAFVPDEVFVAVTPSLAATNGKIVLLSTPHGKQGYFFDCFADPSFKSFHVSSEECPRIDKGFLEKEKKRMTKVQYQQEYLGLFIDELRQFFPTDVIQSCMTIERGSGLTTSSSPPGQALALDNFAGVDVARLGGDETVILSLQRHNRKTLSMIDLDVSDHTHLTETVRRIKAADQRYHYKKIFIDTGGIGSGVFDPLLEDPQTKRKVVPIDNSSRSIDKDDKQKRRLLKEDLYANLLRLMEQKKVALFNDPEIALSLKSIQYEYTTDGNIKIFGSYSHITEALVRAAWCMYDKTLNIWVR